MLRQFALAVLLSGSALAQAHAPVKPYLQQLEQLDEINMNLSAFGGVVHQRIDGDHLTIQWPDKTKAKGRIVRREKIEPDRL